MELTQFWIYIAAGLIGIVITTLNIYFVSKNSDSTPAIILGSTGAFIGDLLSMWGFFPLHYALYQYIFEAVSWIY